MARTHRFGKSLCVTMFKSIFMGHLECFDVLSIWAVRRNFDSKTRLFAAERLA